MPALRIPKPSALPSPAPAWPPRPTTPIPERVIRDIPLQDRILEDYINGTLTPFAVAKKHDLTVDQLIAFVRSDAVCARLKDLESFAKDRARTLAILHLPSAITALAEATLSANPTESRRAASTIVRELNRKGSILHTGGPGVPPVPASLREGAGGGSSASTNRDARTDPSGRPPSPSPSPREGARGRVPESKDSDSRTDSRAGAPDRSESSLPLPTPRLTTSRDLALRNGQPKPSLRISRGTSPPRLR